MQTVLESPTREVRIGPDQPFVIIGERINPTNRSKLAAEMAAGDFSRVKAEALAQVEAGAQLLDVNAGIPLADEPAILAEAVRVVQSVVEVPLCIDSSVIPALRAGLAAYRGKALVNSVTGEEERLEAVLPLVRQHGAAVIGVTNDESGISEDPQVRFRVAQRIVARAESYGIPREDVLIDPLAMPVGAMSSAGVSFFALARKVREELGVNTVCGASNVSFGLPDRVSLNAAFLAMAIASGLTSAITNPLEEAVRTVIRAANVMMGHDENCSDWLRAQRGDSPQEAGDRAARRERRRARAAAGT
ncbi:MAG: dihydropteroate synthase [Anaerolineales bacterium]|jgi:5-methyltetrahydrofolate--homocysteine methyltransferase